MESPGPHTVVQPKPGAGAPPESCREASPESYSGARLDQDSGAAPGPRPGNVPRCLMATEHKSTLQSSPGAPAPTTATREGCSIATTDIPFPGWPRGSGSDQLHRKGPPRKTRRQGKGPDCAAGSPGSSGSDHGGNDGRSGGFRSQSRDRGLSKFSNDGSSHPARSASSVLHQRGALRCQDTIQHAPENVVRSVDRVAETKTLLPSTPSPSRDRVVAGDGTTQP